jgi:Protein of unknown function (DUF4244)
MNTRAQRGAATAEYAVGVVAGCSVVGICVYPVLTSPWMERLLELVVWVNLGGWW